MAHTHQSAKTHSQCCKFAKRVALRERTCGKPRPKALRKSCVFDNPKASHSTELSNERPCQSTPCSMVEVRRGASLLAAHARSSLMFASGACKQVRTFVFPSAGRVWPMLGSNDPRSSDTAYFFFGFVGLRGASALACMERGGSFTRSF